jgi:peptidoglycan-associated lipoprotein
MHLTKRPSGDLPHRYVRKNNETYNPDLDRSLVVSISYGKEKPFCTESTEACWQQNRRAHFVYSK